MNSNKGQIIFQVLIALTITAIIAISSIQMLRSQKERQIRTQIQSKVLEVSAKLDQILKNDTAWAHTVNNNANLSCLQSSDLDCTAQTRTTIDIYDETGNLYYESTNNSAGFDLAGSPCTGYVDGSTGDGNDNCPIRLEITWQPVDRDARIDSSGSTYDTSVSVCTTPPCDSRVSVRFSYNGGDINFSMNEMNYNVDLSRETDDKSAELLVVDRKVAGINGGQCTVDTWVTRDLNSVVIDTGNFVTSLSANTVYLNAGRYQCIVHVPAYIQGDHQARLVVGSSTYVGSTGSYYGSSSIIKADFDITANTALNVQHICETSSGSDIDFGRTVGAGTQTYTTLRCKVLAD